MNRVDAWGLLNKATWEHLLVAVAVLATGYLMANSARSALRRWAERAAVHRRLAILRIVPLVRVGIGAASAACVIPILIEPTFPNVAGLLASASLIVAFLFKDYGSSVVAGLVTIVENTYQPGDWIEVDGTYGEVRCINLRATHVVTPDDTEVIIPHSRLWSTSIFNASGGQRSLLCVTDFYLHPDHDGASVRQELVEIAESSSFKASGTQVNVIVSEKPWGTHYRVKAYVSEGRDQFHMTTDVTIRGKAAQRKMGTRFAQAPYAALAS